MKPIVNSETIEIELVAGQSKYKLPNSTNFSNQKIKGIDVHRIANMLKTPLGRTVCNENALKTASIILNVDGKEQAKNQPLISMSAVYLNGKVFETNDITISLDKSEISFSDTANIVAGEAVCMTFYW